MATVDRPTVTKPMPPDAELYVRKDETLARSKDRNGKARGESLVSLWTWQGAEHSLTTGKIDQSKSDYYCDEQLPGIRDAYRLLFEQLKTDQVIWCYTRENQHPVFSYRRDVEWHLRVPSSCLLGKISSSVWNRLVEKPVSSFSAGSLFLPDITHDATVLLRHPIPVEWILSRRKVVQVRFEGQPITQQKWKYLDPLSGV